MTPEVEKFLDAATLPLDGKAEARDEARTELMGRISHQGLPLEMVDLSQETKALESPVRCPVNLRRFGLLGAVVVFLIIVIVGATFEAMSLSRMSIAQRSSWAFTSYGRSAKLEKPSMLDVWVQQKAPELLLTGNRSRYRGLRDETRVVRQRFPEDLALLQEHLARQGTEAMQFMNEEDRALIARLDPENALWPMMEFKWWLNKANGRATKHSYSRSSVATADPEELARGWEQFAIAVKCSHLRDYSSGLMRRQLDAFPPESTFADSMIQGAFTDSLAGANLMGDRWWFAYSAGDAEDLKARLLVLEKEGGVDGVPQLFEDWKRIRQMMAAELSAVTFYTPNAPSVLAQEARSFASSFKRLGENEMMKEAEGMADRLAKIEVRQYVPSGDPLEGHLSIRAEGGYMIPHDLAVEELKASRMAELAFIERIYAWVGCMLMALLVFCCGFEAYRRSATVQGLSRGLMPLCSMKDQLLIAGLGVAAPWLFWWCVTRLTPLGMRDLGMNDEWRVIGWMLQVIIAVILMVVMLVQTCQWIWEKRGAFLGFRSRVGWLGWLVAGVVALALPAAGLSRYLNFSDEENTFYLLGVAGAGAVGLLWLFWVAGMNLFTPRNSALRANLVSRTLLPWSVLSFGLMVLSVGVLWQAEKFWCRADPLFPSWTSETFGSAFEERAVTELQLSLKAALEEGLGGDE